MERKYWIAIVAGSNEKTKKTHFSFLTLYASNRFQAMKGIRKMLPDNTDWLDEDGTLIPYRVIEMKSVKENESNDYLEGFIQMVQGIFPNPTSKVNFY